MRTQLAVLYEILTKELLDYSPSANDQECVYACFLQSPANTVIDHRDWVSWVFENQEISQPFITKVFKKRFPEKEFFVWIGSKAPGENDYIEILGQNYFSKN